MNLQEEVNIIYMHQAQRHDVINFLIQEHKIENPNYLEIGIQRGITFSQINSTNKTGVDPSPINEGIELTTFKMTSDDFFDSIKNNENNIEYDVIFIDGLHECHQVAKDFINSVKHSKEGSLIIFDDVYPHNENEQKIPVSMVQGPCTGDVWKLIYHILPTMNYKKVDMYFFEKLHSEVRGIFALRVNKDLLNMVKDNLFVLNGYDISDNYEYNKDFSSYANMLK